jgi:hypothetical protein
MDAAGADKTEIAAQAGFPSPFGQSPFALIRGVSFEAQVKANGCAELLRVLRDKLGLSVPEVSYDDLETVGENASREVRFRRSRALLLRAAHNRDDPGTLFDHPMLRLTVGGNIAYLEPDLIAFQLGGQLHVLEIKSFAVIDGQADGEQVAAATKQAAVYILALRDLIAEDGLPAETVSDNVILVTPENFSNRATATFIDARKHLGVLRRQLQRITRIETLLDALPVGVTFDLAPDTDGTSTRPRDDLATAVRAVPARYQPSCLANCELANFCRNEARADGSLDVLGPSVRDELGGLDTITTALGLADGSRAPSNEQADIALALRHAARIRNSLLGGAA